MERILERSLEHQQKAVDAIADVFEGVTITPPTIAYQNPAFDYNDVRILENIVYLDLNSASYDWVDKKHTAYPEEDEKRWKHARHVIAWTDPVSAIITINQNGHLKVEGQRSEFYRGITPVMAGLPATNGRQCRVITPNVQSFEMTLAYPGA